MIHRHRPRLSRSARPASQVSQFVYTGCPLCMKVTQQALYTQGARVTYTCLAPGCGSSFSYSVGQTRYDELPPEQLARHRYTPQDPD